MTNLLIDTRYLTSQNEKIFGAVNWDKIYITESGQNLYYDSNRMKEFEYPQKFGSYINQLTKCNLWEVIPNQNIENISRNFSTRHYSVKNSILSFISSKPKIEFELFTEDKDLINLANEHNIKTINTEELYKIIVLSESRLVDLEHNSKINDIDFIRLYLLIILIFGGFISYILTKVTPLNFDFISILYGVLALLFSIIIYNIKLYSKIIWGGIEVFIGAINSIFVYNNSLNEKSISYTIFFQFIAGIYLISRGLENIDISKKNKFIDSILVFRSWKYKDIK